MGSEHRNVIALEDLGIEQLTSLQKQLEREIEFFSESVTQLKLAAGKFAGSSSALAQLSKSKAGDTSLIPLSESMYIKAKLSEPEKTMVDIGTGYYVEMPIAKAIDFFNRKHKYIQTQVEKVEVLLREREDTRVKIREKVQQKVRAALAAQ